MQHQVNVFYDPKTMDIGLLQKFYSAYGLASPSEDALRFPLFRRNGDGLETALAKYEFLTKAQAMELISAVSDFKNIQTEMSDL
ncbi:MAG: hypothetical protein V1837_04100 [Candidatus Woesearchaeota archaeon]